MEAVSSLLQALAALFHLLFQGALQPLLQALQLLGVCVQLALGILQLPALMQMLHVLLTLSLRGDPGRQQPLPQLFQAFAAAFQPCQRLLAGQTDLQMIQLLASALQIMSGLLEQATLPLLQPMQQGGSIDQTIGNRLRFRRSCEGAGASARRFRWESGSIMILSSPSWVFIAGNASSRWMRWPSLVVSDAIGHSPSA